MNAENQLEVIEKSQSYDTDTFICDFCGDISMFKENYEKHQCDYSKIEENEKPKDDMISLNGTAKTSQLNNETQKENFVEISKSEIFPDNEPHLNFLCTECQTNFDSHTELENHINR